HGTRLNEAFEKKGSSSGAGMANDAALGGMQGEHSAAPQEDTAWGTPHQEPLLRSSIVKRKRTASLVN
ncbi:MAG: hypothetical protein EOS02_37040, partial [Mesorhizobium sp.]